MEKRFQFSLRELIVFVLVLGIAIGITFKIADEVTKSHAHVDAKRRFARTNILALELGLERYRQEFAHFPPDNVPNLNASENLYSYLCVPLKDNQSRTFGPFIEPRGDATPGPSGQPQYISIYGRPYVYKIIHKSGEEYALVIDPGPDHLLGGTIDPEKGFVPDNSDANHDGIPDDQDNIMNETEK